MDAPEPRGHRAVERQHVGQARVREQERQEEAGRAQDGAHRHRVGEPLAADSAGHLRERARRPRAPLDDAGRQGGADRQHVGGREDGQREERGQPEAALGRPRLAEDGGRHVPARVVPHDEGEAQPQRLERLALRRERHPGRHTDGAEAGDGERGDREEREDGERDGRVSRRPDAEHVQRREHGDEPEDEEPALGAGHVRVPEAHVLDEERWINGDVHEAVDPAPPPDLEGPEPPEGAPGPGHVPALLGHRPCELGHGERDGKAPEERREQQEDQRHSGTEGRYDVLDPVGPARDVEEEDRGERKDAELALQPVAQIRFPAPR